MKISYSLLTHNETDSLLKLLEFLVKHKDEEDEIVILDDFSDNEKTKEILDTMCSIHEITFEQRHLLKDYAGQKNYLKNMCTGDYIFNLDADEMISLWMIKNVHEIIEANEGIDLIYLPRINTVDGITDEHCRAYGYRLDENGWINFPDWQGRIFRNRPNIRWQHKVHEMITGYQTYATLPTDKPFCILHPKTIEKQVEQNKFYNEEIS